MNVGTILNDALQVIGGATTEHPEQPTPVDAIERIADTLPPALQLEELLGGKHLVYDQEALKRACATLHALAPKIMPLVGDIRQMVTDFERAFTPGPVTGQ